MNLTYTDAGDAPEPAGLLETASDGNDNVTNYAYNSKGSLTSSKPPLVGTKHPGGLTFTYDTAGRVKTRTDELGKALTYVYDRLDRPCAIATGSQSSLTLCSATPTGAWVKYAYDDDGNLTGRSASAGTTGGASSFGYDNLNRRTSETIAGAPTSSPTTRAPTSRPSPTPAARLPKRFGVPVCVVKASITSANEASDQGLELPQDQYAVIQIFRKEIIGCAPGAGFVNDFLDIVDSLDVL